MTAPKKGSAAAKEKMAYVRSFIGKKGKKGKKGSSKKGSSKKGSSKKGSSKKGSSKKGSSKKTKPGRQASPPARKRGPKRK